MAFRLLEEADYESFNKHFKVLDKDDLDFVSSKETPYESAGYIRGPWLELHDAIHKLQDAKSSEPQRNMLRIYADTLVSRSKVDLPDMALVVLFARNLFPTSSSSDPVKIGATRGATITMYSGVPGRELPFEITTSSGTVRENVTIPASHSGVELYIKPEGAITVHEKNMDKKLLGPANPIDQLEDDGNFREIDQDTNGARLIYYQMLLAVAWEDEFIQDSLALATFVAIATQGIPSVLDLHVQAKTFLSRHIAAGDSIQQYVPPIDLSVTKQVLKSRLATMTAFDDTYQKFLRRDQSNAELKSMANLTLQAAIDADISYNFLGGLTEKRYVDAKKALALAQEKFATLQTQMKSAQDDLSKGIEKWAADQTHEAQKQIFWAIVTATVSIAQMVYNPAGGAEGAEKAAEKAISVVEKGAETTKKLSKLKEIFDKLKKLYEVMMPMLKAAHAACKTVQNSVDELKGHLDPMKKADTGMKAEKPPGTGSGKASDIDPTRPMDIRRVASASDTINLEEEWSKWRIEMLDMLKIVINEKIDGAEGFRDMIDILVNRANAVLKCQVVVTQTGDQYMITLAQSAPSARQTDRLRKSIANMVDDEKIIKVFRMSMMQRIMAIRAWVCLDFQAYVSAYMWYSLDDSPPIRTNPMKALGYFVNDAAILQASVVEADQRIRSQERAFIYSTTDNASHPFGDWRRLLKERFVDFEIPLQDPKFKGYSRIRVQKIRVYLHDATSPSSTIQLKITCGGDVADYTLDSPPSPRRFLMPPSTLIFEYEPATRRIIMDGEYKFSSIYVKPSPFTAWTIAVRDPDVDLAGVTGITMELVCAVSVQY